MAKLVRIKNVHLMTGLTAGAADCVLALQLLRSTGIKFNVLSYSDQDEHHRSNFESISGWPLGREGKTKTVTDYPLMTWDECWDDWTVCRQVAHGLAEIRESDVARHPELVRD